MRAGSLNEVIDILKLKTTRNEYGEQCDTYEKSYTTRAFVRSTSGGRADINNEVFYEHSYVMEIRYYVPVDDFDHIMWKDKEYRILNIDYNRLLNHKVLTVELINK